MTKAEIVAEVEKRLGLLDERTERAIEVAVELVEQPTMPQPEPKWQGENPPFEETAEWDMDADIRIMDELRDRNLEWLEKKRKELGARWMLVVDGKVLMHGPTLQNYPTDDELDELCLRTGKMPLLHEAPLLIEEGTLWNPTIYPTDFYPTLSVTFAGKDQSVEVVADFDTGSPDVCVDAELLRNRGVIQIRRSTRWVHSTHLGQHFWYTRKHIEISLTAADGSRRSAVHRVLCVRNWHQSPFVAINPNRNALVGRDVCLQLQPNVLLNFSRHETTVHW